MRALIAMPSVRGAVCIQTMHTVINMIETLRENGVDAGFAWQTYAEVHTARNMLTQAFLDSGADLLIFIDDDMAIESHVVRRLLGAGLPLVGVYAPPRGLDLQRFADYIQEGFSVREACHAAAPLIGPQTRADDAIVEVDYIGGGVLFIRREVFATLDQAGLAPAYEHSSPAGATSFRGYFNPVVTDQQLTGEDFAFCQRYRQAGGRIYAYKGEGVSHFGMMRFDS